MDKSGPVVLNLPCLAVKEGMPLAFYCAVIPASVARADCSVLTAAGVLVAPSNWSIRLRRC